MSTTNTPDLSKQSTALDVLAVVRGEYHDASKEALYKYLKEAVRHKRELNVLIAKSNERLLSISAGMQEAASSFDSGKLTREKVQELTAALTKIMGA